MRVVVASALGVVEHGAQIVEIIGQQLLIFLVGHALRGAQLAKGGEAEIIVAGLFELVFDGQPCGGQFVFDVAQLTTYGIQHHLAQTAGVFHILMGFGLVFVARNLVEADDIGMQLLQFGEAIGLPFVLVLLVKATITGALGATK